MEQNIQGKQIGRSFSTSILIVVSICLISTAAVWVAMSKSAAETPVGSGDANSIVLEEPETLDPFLEMEDKLASAAAVFELHGYLVLDSSLDSDARRAEYLIVSTASENALYDLIISLETKLWAEHGWAFQTEYDEEEMTAKVYLSDGGHGFELKINQMNPRIQLADNKPKLAIVIDDWGYSSVYAEAFLQYPFPLTTAIIPYLPQSVRLAERAAAHGHEVILHQPMEALNSHLDLGEGGILTSMAAEEIQQRMRDNIAHLPMIAGVNNHMGSKVTADAETMGIVLEVIKDHGLYFLDSSTTPLSVADQAAVAVGLPYAVNNLFIDNVNEVEAVKQQLRQIMKRAVRDGSAIAIGHVRSATAVAVWEMIPEFAAAGIDLVPVSQLLINPEKGQAAETEMTAGEAVTQPADYPGT